MPKDTQQELQRLEKALLAEEKKKLEQASDLDEFLEGLLDEHTDSLAKTGSMVYHNYANGYGRNTQPEPEPEPKPEPRRENLNAQMFTVAGLLVGIGAVILYWVVRFL